MNGFVKVGTRWINPALVTSVSETRPGDSAGKGRRLRVDFHNGTAEYFDAPEDIDAIMALVGADDSDKGKKGGK